MARTQAAEPALSVPEETLRLASARWAAAISAPQGALPAQSAITRGLPRPMHLAFESTSADQQLAAARQWSLCFGSSGFVWHGGFR